MATDPNDPMRRTLHDVRVRAVDELAMLRGAAERLLVAISEATTEARAAQTLEALQAGRYAALDTRRALDAALRDAVQARTLFTGGSR